MVSVVDSLWWDSTTADPDTPIEVGRRGRMVMRLPGRRAEFINERTEYQPGRVSRTGRSSGPISLETVCLGERTGGSCAAPSSLPPSGCFVGLSPTPRRPQGGGVIRCGFSADSARLKTMLKAD